MKALLDLKFISMAMLNLLMHNLSNLDIQETYFSSAIIYLKLQSHGRCTGPQLQFRTHQCVHHPAGNRLDHGSKGDPGFEWTWGDPFRAASFSLSIRHPPAQYDPRPRPHVTLTRREILRRDNYTCQYCGKHSTELTVDHIMPRHLGGKHTWENVVAACPSCNHRKGGRTLGEASMQLHHHPHEPPLTAYYVFGRYLNQYEEWEEFLHGW